MATRWGICGTGLIANDFVTAVKTLPASEHQVVAVAARADRDKAETFAQKYNIPTVYSTYEDLAKDNNVDIVYVGTIHAYHHQVCLMYLEYGKPVLCEKPMTMNLKECEEVIAKAREKKVFFMEAFWTRFFPAYASIVEELNSGSLGHISCIRSTFALPSNIALLADSNKWDGGSLLGMGCYAVLLVQQVFKGRPEKIVAVGQFSEEGVETGGSLTVQYKGGELGIMFHSRNLAAGSSTATFHGTLGNLEVHDDMHTPTRVTYPGTKGTRHFPLPDTNETFNFPNSIGLVYEAQAVRECLLKGLTECPEMSHEDSLTIMYILDEASRQLGLQFPSPQD